MRRGGGDGYVFLVTSNKIKSGYVFFFFKKSKVGGGGGFGFNKM